MKKLYVLAAIFFLVQLISPSSLQAQSVLNPNDTVVNYDPNNPPAIPTQGGVIVKWVRTPKMNWNTSAWKAYYYSTGYKTGMAFRLLFPKTYLTDPPGTKYPVLVFFHGVGEVSQNGPFDNELQLLNCGQKITDSALLGSFDAFVLFPQEQTKYWNNYYSPITSVINYLIANNNADPSRIIVTGLSEGGQATWLYTINNPSLIAGSVPMCAATMSDAIPAVVDSLQDIPIWLTQGGLDTDPYPSTATNLVNYLTANGINIRYTLYPSLGHGVWNQHYAEPDAFQWMLNVNKTNPHVYSGRTYYCAGDSIRDTLGITQGFQAYQWSNNGVVIPGADSNTLIVTDTGTYAARYMLNGQWTYWSPQPAHITYRTTTYTPPIQIAGLMSGVIPAPDGNTSVTLTEPSGYTSYQWMDSTGKVVGANQTFAASAPGYYTAMVTQLYGCSAQPSAPFYVASSTGPNPPSPATDLSGYPLSQTSVQLNWSQNLHPVNKQTAFEIYRATQSGGPYTLAGIVPADTLGFVDNGLSAGVKYFYTVRAIDSTAAAPLSPEDSVSTILDRQPPTAPGNLHIANSSDNSVSITWDSSTDNVSVQNYYVYINGVRSFVTPNTYFTLNNLVHDSAYVLTVKAVDPTGNISAPSSQIIAVAAYRGLTYYYYTYAGTWNNIPDLSALTPTSTGLINNVNLSPATQANNFAFSFQGIIRISQPGTYTFYTNSDDGSKLYINDTQVVNNDGPHGATEKSGTYTFTQPGVYPFRVDYFQGTGSSSLSVSWQASALSIPKSAIPDSAFAEPIPLQTGTAPAKPTDITATANAYNRISLSWTNNSSNAKGFEIYRNTGSGQPWLNVATTNASATSWVDTTVSPATTYYYKVQAVNQYGPSGFDTASMSGLNYSYYQPSGNLSAVPNFNALTPVSTGVVPNVTLSIAQRSSTFAIKFVGPIKIPATGTYTFYTTSDDGSNLYIDGMDSAHLVVANDSLHAAIQKSGNVTLTAGTHIIYITYFQAGGGSSLTASWQGSNFSEGNIPDSAFSANNVATTPALPPVPSAPFGLNAITASQSAISLSWKDSSNNITGYDLYRSDGNNTTYRLLKQLPPDNTAYIDSGLFNNTLYYYKVAAVGLGGVSEYSNEMSAVTGIPQRPGSAIYINMGDGVYNGSGYWNNTATSNIGQGTTFQKMRDTVGNITGVGMKLLTARWNHDNTGWAGGFQGSPINGGLYPDSVIHSDYYVNSGSPQQIQIFGLSPDSSYSFTFFGSDYASNRSCTYQINGQSVTLTTTHNISNTVSINGVTADSTGTVTITVTAGPGSPYGSINALVIHGSIGYVVPSTPTGLTATFNAPAVTLNWDNISGNQSGFEVYRATVLSPGYTMIGSVGANVTTFSDSTVQAMTHYTYKIVAFNSYGNSAFSDSVQMMTPGMGAGIIKGSAIYINMGDGVYNGSGYWNNTSLASPPVGTVFSNLKDTLGGITNIGLKVITPGLYSDNSGLSTGNNSGIYPDNVILSDYYVVSGYPVNMQVFGLSTDSLYNFTFFGSAARTPRSCTYQLNGRTVTLTTANNTFNTATISGIKVDSTGTVTITVAAGPGSPYGSINALVIHTYAQTSASPQNVTVSNIAGSPASKVQVIWQPGSPNTDSIKVYRSTNRGSLYTLLNPGMANGDSTSYTDSTVGPNTTYYYYLVAVNANGNSSPSDTAGITTLGIPDSLEMQPIANISMGTGSADTSLVYISNADSTISFTLRNAPSFVSVQKVNDSTASLVCIPSVNDMGVYDSVTLMATLANGDTATQYFKVSVTDGGISSKWYLNFTAGGNLYSLPWNNIVFGWSSNLTYHLVNSTGSQTPVSLKVVNTWSGTQNYGANTYTNSGVVPDSVMATFYYLADTGTRTLMLTGLDTAKRYNIVFFGSANYNPNGTSNYTTNYSINGQAVSLNGLLNTSNTTRINGIKPDSLGNITITVQKGSAANWGLLNAMIVEGYDSSALVTPGNLTAVADGTPKVTLNWADRSGSETDFLVMRSDSLSGSYTQLIDLPANTSTYVDANVSPNTRYFYKIIATNAAGQSDPSNIASVTTPQYAVYVNFNNSETRAAAPWNNTQAAPQAGAVYGPFLNSNGNNTGITLNMITNFEGENPVGVVTGNNSGIYPDLVMQSTYYQDNGLDTIYMQVSNLDLTLKYDVTLFSSIAGWGWINTTQFIANGQMVSLEASYNSSNTVTLHGLTPDQNGQIMVKIIYTPQSRFAILNAMVIKAYSNYDDNGNPIINPNLLMFNRGMSAIAGRIGLLNKDTAASFSYQIVRAYPNPFSQSVNVVISSQKNDRLLLSLIGSNGSLMDKQIEAVSQGINTIRYQPFNNVAPGFYILNIRSVTTAKSVSVKLIKQ